MYDRKNGYFQLSSYDIDSFLPQQQLLEHEFLENAPEYDHKDECRDCLQDANWKDKCVVDKIQTASSTCMRTFVGDSVAIYESYQRNRQWDEDSKNYTDYMSIADISCDFEVPVAEWVSHSPHQESSEQ